MSETGLKCRPIVAEDLAGVEACLIRHFPEKTPRFWRNALAALGARETSANHPRFGFCLAKGGEIVGVLLQIFSSHESAGGRQTLCHLSSWCADDEFRFMAPSLSLAATRRKDVTYVNISPAPHTRPAITAMGYQIYARGQVVFLPLASRRNAGARIVAFEPGSAAALALPEGERALLADHQRFGCETFIGLIDGAAYGFVTARARILRNRILCERILYCRDLDSLARFARAIGAHLSRRGRWICVVDANATIPGLVGRYVAGRESKYFKGGSAPRLGDLAYSEIALFDARNVDASTGPAVFTDLPAPLSEAGPETASQRPPMREMRRAGF